MPPKEVSLRPRVQYQHFLFHTEAKYLSENFGKQLMYNNGTLRHVGVHLLHYHIINFK